MSKRALIDTVVSCEASAENPFVGLPDELFVILLAATGFDIFACNCLSRDVNAFIATKHVFRAMREFRFLYHERDLSDYYRDAFELTRRLTPTRLQLMQPSFFICVPTWTGQKIGLDQLGGSLASLWILAMDWLDWSDSGAPRPVVLGPLVSHLTNLRRLSIDQCYFARHCNSARPTAPDQFSPYLAALTNLEKLTIIADDASIGSYSFLRDMTRLQHLALYTRRDLPLQPRDVSHLLQLELLVMDAAPIVASGPDAFASLTNLKSLYVEKCGPGDDALVTRVLSPPSLSIHIHGMPPGIFAGDCRTENSDAYYWPSVECVTDTDADADIDTQ